MYLVPAKTPAAGKVRKSDVICRLNSRTPRFLPINTLIKFLSWPEEAGHSQKIRNTEIPDTETSQIGRT